MSNHPASLTLGKDDVYPVPTLDGSETLYNKRYGDTYHSVYGAVSESRHVFIQNGLMSLINRPSIRILELGFGTGLNAFLSFLVSLKHAKPLYYTGIETDSIDIEIVRQLAYPSYLVAQKHQDLFLRMHLESSFSENDFTFHRRQHLEKEETESPFDCIFFDAFSPTIQEPLWAQSIFDQIFRMTTVGGCLVTYSAQGAVRRKMEKAGYQVERLPGAPGKRQMMRASKT